MRTHWACALIYGAIDNCEQQHQQSFHVRYTGERVLAGTRSL